MRLHYFPALWVFIGFSISSSGQDHLDDPLAGAIPVQVDANNYRDFYCGGQYRSSDIISLIQKLHRLTGETFFAGTRTQNITNLYNTWRQPDLLPQRNDRLAWSDFGRSLNTQWSMIGHRIQTAVANYIVYTSKKTASQQKLSIIVQAQENPCGSTPMGGECSASALLEMTEMLRNVLGFNLSSTGRGLKEQVKIIREVAGWWLRQKQGEYIGPNLGGF